MTQADTIEIEYISPKMTGGHPYDQRVDLYSFGIILYKLFFGLEQKKVKYDCGQVKTRKCVVPKATPASNHPLAQKVVDVVNKLITPHEKDQIDIDTLKQEIKLLQ